jgi:hypothetical protein
MPVTTKPPVLVGMTVSVVEADADGAALISTLEALGRADATTVDGA